MKSQRICWTVVLFCLILLISSCKSKEERNREAAQEHYKKGVELKQAGKLNEAAIELRNAIQKNPELASAYYQLSVVLLQQEDFKQGYGSLNKSVELYKNMPTAITDPAEKEMMLDARLRVAEIYFDQGINSGDFSRAFAELKDILELDPKMAGAYVLRGRVNLAAGSLAKDDGNADEAAAKFESASADAKQALESQADNAAAHVLLGQIALLQEQPEVARPELEKAVELDPKNVQAYISLATLSFQNSDFEKALELYKKAVELAPKNLQALAGLGETHLSKNEYDAAVQMAERMLAAIPRVENQISREEIGAKFILGRAYLMKANSIEADKADEAKTLYEKAIAELEPVVANVTQLPAANYSLGISYSKVGKFDQAIDQFQRVLAVDPNNLSTLQNLAVAYFQEQQYDAAIEQAKKAAAVDPKNLTIQKLLLDAYLRTNNGEGAQATLAAIETLSPNDPALSINKAMVALQARNYPEAVKQAEAALSSGQETGFTYNILGRAQAGANDYEGAMASLKKAIELSPDFVSARLGLADLYVKTQQFDLAEKEANDVLNKRADVAEAHFILGLVAIGRNQLDAAKSAFEKALSIKNDLTDAQYQLALVQRGLGNAPEALALLEQVIAIEPNNVAALTNSALWAFESRNYDAALAAAEKLRQADAKSIVALNILGAIYAQTGRFDEAMVMVDALKQIQPDAPNIDATLAAIYLGKKDFAKAIELTQQAIAKDAENPMLYDTLGRAYVGNEELENAEQAFTTALEKQPDYYSALLGLGNLYGIQRKYADALQQYQHALKLRANSAEAMVGVAGVYVMTGKLPEALASFENALTVEPNATIALFNAADVAIRLGQYEKTIEYAGRVLEQDVQNTNARYLLAQAYVLQGDMNKASVELEDLSKAENAEDAVLLDLGIAYLRQEAQEEAKAMFERVLARNDAHMAALLGAAVATQQIGAAADAVAFCERAITAQPNNPMSAFVLGNLYVAQNNYELARVAFANAGEFYKDLPFDDAAIATYYGDEPEKTAVLISTANILLARGWGKEAINALTDITVTKTAREGVIVRYALARAYSLEKQTDKAIVELEAIVAAQPTMTSVLKTLGAMYLGNKDTQKAIDAYKKYMDANSADHSGRIQLALAYENANMVDEAITEYTTVLQAAPDSALTKNQLAWLYAEKGQNLDEALRLAQEAAEAQPIEGLIDTLGWVYFKRGEFDNAIAKFQEAAELNPLQPTIQYHLAVVYAEKGEKELALQALEAAFALSADFKEAADAKTLQEKLKQQ